MIDTAIKLALDTPQFFFDEEWIAHGQRVARRWLPAEVYPEPILRADRPWEGPAVVLYGTVLPHPAGKGYRLYYSNFVPGVTYSHAGRRRAWPCTMLAESEDGLNWRKPELDIYPTEDGAPTNRVYCPGDHWDSPSLLDDPADAEARYKMMGYGFDTFSKRWGEKWGMYGLASRDGLHWQSLRPDGLPILRAGDRSNLLPERVEGEYCLYTRHKEMWAQTGCRAIYLSRSRDFREWSEPELVLAPDRSDEPEVEFYGISVFRRHGWFIGLLEYWRSESDCIEVHLAFSRDGRRWERPQPHVPFIGASCPWNAKWTSCAGNGPIYLNEQMVFYFGGRLTSHHYDSARLHGAIGYASLALDRFCALEGRYPGSHIVTVPFAWPGGQLVLNADTRESYDSHPLLCEGEIAVEVLDAEGTPLPEWSGEQKATFRGNTHCRGAINAVAVRWPGERGLDRLTGQTIRLRFTLHHARLFTFEASSG